MEVTINLPEELIRCMGKDVSELSHAAIEALVLEGVRSGKLSVAQARRVLGFRSRHQMESFLKSHGVDLPLTIEQIRSDSDNALAFKP
jgi:hypothetical protein